MRLRDLGNTADRGRARRGHHPHRRLGRGHRPRRRRARRPGRRRRARVERSAGQPRVASPASTCRAARGSRSPAAAHGQWPERTVTIEGAREHNLQNVDVDIPAGLLRGRHRRVAARASPRWSTTSSTPALAQRRSTASEAPPGRHQADRRAWSTWTRSSTSTSRPIGRTPRSNPATYTGVFDHIRKLFAKTPEAKIRGYLPGRFSLQRQGRPLRGLRRRRHHQDRDALPARRVRALRGVPRRALQPGDPRGALQGPDHRRGPGHADRGGPRVLRRDPRRSPGTCRPWWMWAWATCAWASRRPTLSGGEAQRVKLASELPATLHRADHLRARRAHHRPALRGRRASCWACCTRWWTRATPSSSSSTTST